MSLEQALQENTETMKRLIAVMEAARTTGCHGSEKAAVQHPVKDPAAEAKLAVVEKAADVLTYDDVKKPFLKLVQTKRAAAMEVMAHFGVENMQKIPQTQEAFAEAICLIAEAQNG